ncbi:glutamate 5-kinase [Schizosaccharomyces japonicus yFS275]|uniref:Glutamate 5-kinase n=1 Tax=Schizosaccharomyces japonicus (strain yFS275 / FY16936) TaxID=402676 RepID=B6K4A4_SCHJY|nr:glutamate 5-kinase [Schizosaccharomyces japonicus yFS275]EEB08311.1 glutamate 5-kinase [Schizosaccharomyces japonicus yFS275]
MPTSTNKGDQKGHVIVIKLGTSSICDEKTHEPLICNLSMIVETVVKLRRQGHSVVIVSSGGIGMGLRRMDLPKRPKKLSAVQAIAAIGQGRLISLWDNLFSQLRQPIAQVLLTRNDIMERNQYLNAANTLHELMHMGVVPIVNENDTLSVQEIRFGDNDTLSAITANMINADFLFLMTDVECLYTANPRVDPNAKPVTLVHDISAVTADVSSPGSGVGTGGMRTKLIAAELGTSAGVDVIICKSTKPSVVFDIINDIGNADKPSHKQNPGLLYTRFVANKGSRMRDRHFWLKHGLKPFGRLIIDKGAYAAISRTNRAGLLPVGVIGVEGHFSDHQSVSLVYEGVEIGCALVNYSSTEIELIRGKNSSEIGSILGYYETEYVAHRDNLVINKPFQP